MIFAEKSQLMLKYQKAKAKLVEYEVNKNEYPHFPLNSNELSYPTTYILSRYAESVIEQDNEAQHHFGGFLTKTAQYYDAAVNSEDRANYDVDFLISGAVAYFLANDFGSAKVLLQKVYSKIDLAEKSPHVFIVRMLAFLLNNNQISQLDGDDLYCNLNNAIRKYYGEGEGKEYIATLLSKYRQEVYAEDNVNDVFFVDLFVAMMMTAIEKAAWELLPIYTKSHNGEWMDYLHNKSSIKMLWPAQQLIGASNLLRGANGIVQLPTGVGKTKSIELIIRSSFIAGRASTVVIVAPLRALCNEITTDMVKTFGADVKINQLSDVLQEDIILFEDPSNKQIAICTPEKLSYILHHQKDIVNLIDLFVFDEAHMFDDGERGATYELLVTYIKETINEEQQLILMSAVLPNADEIKNWLFPENGVLANNPEIASTPKSIGFVSEKRDIYYFSDNTSQFDYYIPRIIQPVKLNRLPNERKDRYFPTKDTTQNISIDIAIFNALKLCHNGGVAIYMGQQRSITTVFNRLVDLTKRGLDLNPFLFDADKVQLEKIENFFAEYYGQEHVFTRVSKFAVVPHSSNLPNGIKLATEFALKQDHIRIVVCTSTLAQGVNIPIRYLLVTTLRANRDYMKIRNFQNLIGRTARSGIFTEGSIVITDPRIYDQRDNRKGYYTWKQCSSMLNPDSSEPCSSSILKLVQDIQLDYENKLSAKDFVNYYIKHIEEENVIESMIQKLTEAYSKAYPGKDCSNIYAELIFRRNVIEAIESYLFLAIENDEIEDREITVQKVCKETLAYSLANEEEKSLLETVFSGIAKKIENFSNEAVHKFARSMSGIELSSKIAEWIAITGVSELLKSEEECLNVIIPFFKSIFPIKKCQDEFDRICELWIQGKLPIEISNITNMEIADIEDVCSKTISYELNFFVGSICDMLTGDEDIQIDRLKNMLNMLQKKLKYGVANQTAISICEKVFYDRLLAMKISDIIGLENLSPNEIIGAVIMKKDAIFSCLEKYPAYFEERLRSLI